MIDMLILIAETDTESKIKSSGWIWVLDNFNVHHHIRHEREGQCSS